MQEINITKATINEIDALIEIGKTTFHETYANRNSDSDMEIYLRENFNEDKMSMQLRNQDSYFFIAWSDTSPIGYLKLNTNDAQSDLQENDSLEIERIYVLAKYHGRKIGQLLYQQAINTAKALNKRSIWLGVWEENARAIRFYEKNGFIAFDKHIFRVGSEDQTDHLMRKML